SGRRCERSHRGLRLRGGMAATARASGFALTARLASATGSFSASFSLALARLGLAARRGCCTLGRLVFGTAIRVGNALSDQFFDCDHRLLVERGDDGNRSAGAARTPGAA